MTKDKMTKKQLDELWIEQCKTNGLDDLAKSILNHSESCKKHGLFHITEQALKYHKQITH
jgi:hypothetical protein